jgi:adenylylsulfate kinase
MTTDRKENSSKVPTTQDLTKQTSETHHPTNNPSSSSAPTNTTLAVQTVGKSTNIAWHNSTITRQDIQVKNKHKSTILWFTGLSGSGKSTLANVVQERLFQRVVSSHVLDGDNIRHGLCQDLGFSPHDRQENIRRIGHVAKLFMDAGLIVLTAFVSPFRSDRDAVRSLVSDEEGGSSKGTNFIEVFCSASIQICETRDTKGLYAKARAGTIAEFTGISSPYEEPVAPEIRILTGEKSLEECIDQIIKYLEDGGIIPKL